VFNIDTWAQLSDESRTRMIGLLPPTAFTTFVAKIDPNHPSVSDARNAGEMEVDEDPGHERSLQTFDPSFFTDPHLLAALRTFQDHLYTGWMAPSHKQDVESYLDGIRSGLLHAPWKDYIWERDRREEDEADDGEVEKSTAQRETHGSLRVGCARFVYSISIIHVTTGARKK